MLMDTSDGSSIALRNAVQHMQQSDGNADAVRLWLALVATDIGCDIFLALRLFYLAQLTIACIMFVILNHGVINVIFSVLAVAFGMEIDCKFMEMLVNFGFEQSPVYICKVRPALMSIVESDRRQKVKTNRRPEERMPQVGNTAMSLAAKISRMGRKRRLWGLETSKWWALLLTSLLLLSHQYWSLTIAINSGPSVMEKQLDAVFQEFSGLPQILLLMMVASYGCAFFNTICYHGLVALPSLMQLGLSGLWVYAVIRNYSLLGVLAWYSDVLHTRSFMEQFFAAVHVDALLIYPALGLHLFLAITRPWLLMLCTSIAGEKKKARG
jgi:hypothetical protein